ncbi:hypothetical protein F4824DRAFT_90360 [Ustulina deusta]|nr:hypothetical protein F4824DRAFT_90360 [Ustulina deusta]
MGSSSPPKRMTRARAAAASAAAATLSPKSSTSARVTKSTKATTASAKMAAAKKTTTAAKKLAAATKPVAVKKPVPAKKIAAAKKPTAKTAAKATTAATNTTVTTPAAATGKRKLRTFDTDDDEDDLSKEDNTQRTMNHPAKKLRGRAKKAVDPEPESESEIESESQSKPRQKAAPSTTTNSRATRGRPKKSTVTTASSSAAKKQTPSAVSYTRTRKTGSKDDDTDDLAAATQQPTQKTTRRRAAAGTITTAFTTEPTPGLKSAVSRPASKVTGVLKKTVTFEEPEKENMLPSAATKAKTEATGTAATGMRAKPVRKPTASGRTTRASARAATMETTEKKPLSPKKDGQNRPLSRDASSSDDELATDEKTPLKPLMKSPVKPPSGVRKLELLLPDKQKDENSPQSSELSFASVFSSPARRLPSSPFKNAMMSPAKRVDPAGGLFTSTNAEQAVESPTKLSMLMSPAKRPHMPLQAFQFNQEQVTATRSPMKPSLLSTPAKRPALPMKLLGSPVSKTEEKSQEVSKEYTHSLTEEISEDEQLQSQIRAETEAISPEESAVVEKTLEPIQEFDNEDSLLLESPTPQLEFPGRLSAVLPRHADPALKKNPLPVPELTIHSTQLNIPEPEESKLVMSESPKNELNVEAPPDDGMDIHEATAEEQPKAVENQVQHVDSCAAESMEQFTNACEPQSELQSIDKSEAVDKESAILNSAQTTPPQVASKRIGFGLRAKDLEDDDMSDSEDELAFSNKAITKHQDNTTADSVPVTPASPIFKSAVRKIPASAARAANRAIRSVSRSNRFSYTPLSVQLGAWRASSPLKASQSQQKPASQTEDAEDDDDEYSLLDDNEFAAVETPAAKGFFNDEMKIRADMDIDATVEAYLEAEIAAKLGQHDVDADIVAKLDKYGIEADVAPTFDKSDEHNVGIMHEDLSIITEVTETSLLNTPESEQSRSRGESVSAASQEYGDENVVPIDPALFSNEADAPTSNNVPVTPKRPFAFKEFHTVSKVPLKRADDSPPRSYKRLCSTASKVASRRPSGPYSNVTLPSQRSSSMSFKTDQESKLPPVTPSKSVPWSLVGTPARATRPDLDPALLRGAIVFVDVHTTEGADAGTIFVDLLIQMGARCVKSWPWNPAALTDGKVDASKVGITHVVFKDGGKRTLEKVNESNGNVQCVGVGWVLDCEKENRWVDEKDYRVDTSLIPRGGHNRRKSMEPKAVANMNGTLVTPMKASSSLSREPQTVPNNYMSRRDSTIWMRSPSEHDEEEDAPSEPSEMDWESTNAPILTPFPQTPAPETVAKFARDVTPGTPTGSFSLSSDKNRLLMQTCPPKPSGPINVDGGLVNHDQNSTVMMRLMAARRKSMQFAPKVESPLKNQWKQMD